MRTALLIFTAIFCLTRVSAQNYTSYRTGSPTELVTQPNGGVCLMGGATEDDNAMTWFLQRANGGDILVLRASGSDGYNDYLYSQLGVSVNSVETIVCHNASASNEAYLHQRIQEADGIWLAGGDQWDYVSYWRNTPVADLLNAAIQTRKAVIGGTSAGMAIQGGIYFSAQNGTVTSNTALNNPYNNSVIADSSAFLSNDYLETVLTDTHYDNPDRKGRHVVFLARIFEDYGIQGKGIACDEYTAVCIDTNGIARVFGAFPDYDDNAYFIQPNCELADGSPEICTAGTPLTWYHGGEALKVYAVKGNASGGNTLDLKDWKTGNGGIWQHWSVQAGILSTTNGSAPNCTASLDEGWLDSKVQVYPNPSSGLLYIESTEDIQHLSVTDMHGRTHLSSAVHASSSSLDLGGLERGVYLVSITLHSQQNVKRIVVE